MRKKLLFILGTVFLLGLSFTAGYFVRKNVTERAEISNAEPRDDLLPSGQELASKDLDLQPEQKEEMEKLAALGYVSGDTPAGPQLGVTVYKKPFVYEGLNFYTSGHAPEAILMDMNGNVLHRWKYTFEKFWPEHPPIPDAYRFWRRAYLYPNGDLLAIFEGYGLIKVNKDSRMIWGFREPVHHALDVLPDGTIYVLTRKPRIIPSMNRRHPILEDFITILDTNGRAKKSISVIETFQKSVYAPLLKRIVLRGDIFHTNSITVLDGKLENKSPVFRKGNLLISCAHTDTIAIIDPNQDKVVWTASGMWREQHQPVLLASGNLMVFDNQGPVSGSRIIEIDPLTKDVRWSYEAGDFYSHSVGSVQRLKNGNTLITQSWSGRVFEVTPEKQIVWEFHNPYRAGDKKEFVAMIPEMIRISNDFLQPWLHSSK